MESFGFGERDLIPSADSPRVTDSLERKMILRIANQPGWKKKMLNAPCSPFVMWWEVGSQAKRDSSSPVGTAPRGIRMGLRTLSHSFILPHVRQDMALENPPVVDDAPAEPGKCAIPSG